MSMLIERVETLELVPLEAPIESNQCGNSKQPIATADLQHQQILCFR